MSLKDKDARNKYIYAWQKANPEKVKKYKEISKERNKEKRKQKQKEYDKTYDEKYPGRRAQLKRERRRRNNPNFHNHSSKYWRDEHPEEVEDYRKNGEKYSYLKHKNSRLDKMHEKILNLRCETIYWYSNGKMCCDICGENKLEFLAIDHINGGGTEHRKKEKGNFLYYLIRNNFPEGYRILCHNCNTNVHISNIVRKNPLAPYHKYRDRVRLLMLQKYSGKTIPECMCCKENNLNVLTLHHINGNGCKHRRENKIGNLAIFLYKNPLPLKEITVLCQNCNKSLGHYGYCPHDDK